MSSINLFKYFKKVDKELEIKHCRLSDYDLDLSGEGWSLYTDYTFWRIIKEKKILYTSDDLDENHTEEFNRKSNEILKLLQGAIISEILPLSEFMIGSKNGDIKFIFNTGLELHLFSTNTFEPWVLSLPGLTFIPIL